MKKQNKKLRILAFCWGEPKLIEPYLNFINALSNCLPLKIIFITLGRNGKLAFLFKGHQVFTIKELLSLAENYNEDLPPIDLQDLVEYDKALNLKLVESPGSYNFDDYYRFQAKQILKAYNILWKTIKPNLVLTWNGFVSIQKVLAKLSKYYKIPVFYLERGLMPGKLSIYKEGINYGSEIGGDKWHKLIPPYPTEKEIILVGRICVIIISVIALILALRPSDTILGIVAYAWGGFGAAFGPLVLFGLFSKKISWQSALAGMVMGTVVLVVWKQIGLGEYMYEIVPGFIANCMTIFLVNITIGQKDEKILEQYQDVVRTVRGEQ